MKLKKITAAAIAAAFAVLTLSACGTASDTPDTAADATEQTAENEIVTTAATTAEVIRELDDITATELASKMTIGWNVGNSLDAVAEDMGLDSETSWGNPKINRSLIQSVKEAGFNTVRIPVTWNGHFGDAPKYTIDREWLDRVRQVVDYAMENDMYAIINIHHDGNDYGTAWLTPEPEDEDEMVGQFEKIWGQIADYFKGYDERLLFAGMNEFHKGYDSPSSEYLELTDRLNQTFVDTVRASGGNNGKRILIVQGYNTSAEQTLKMTVPEDTAENKLMVEFHFYDPWNFAGSGYGDWGVNGVNTDGWGQESWVDDIFGRMKEHFIDEGIPVVLGEYGATINKDGNDDFRRYYIEYVTKAAEENRIVPIYWDNGYDGTEGEGFAIFHRAAGSKLHNDIHKGMMRAISGVDYTIPLPEPAFTEEPES